MDEGHNGRGAGVDAGVQAALLFFAQLRPLRNATMLPKPPWFVTNKKAHILGELLTQFEHKPSFLKIPRIFLNAMLG